MGEYYDDMGHKAPTDELLIGQIELFSSSNLFIYSQPGPHTPISKSSDFDHQAGGIDLWEGEEQPCDPGDEEGTNGEQE